MVPEKIIRVAQKKGLNGIAITDHNTIKGGLQAKKRNSNNDFHVIVGSEIQTETCEIIGLFLSEEISSTDPFEVLDKIEDQGGITVLPHPFRSLLIPRQTTQKRIPVEIIQRVHAIEVINSRTQEKDNCKALTLASRIGKPMLSGSDAHFYQEIGPTKTIVDFFSSEEELRKSILEGRTHVEQKHGTFLKVMMFIPLCAIYSQARKLSQKKKP